MKKDISSIQDMVVCGSDDEGWEKKEEQGVILWAKTFHSIMMIIHLSLCWFQWGEEADAGGIWEKVEKGEERDNEDIGRDGRYDVGDMDVILSRNHVCGQGVVANEVVILIPPPLLEIDFKWTLTKGETVAYQNTFRNLLYFLPQI